MLLLHGFVVVLDIWDSQRENCWVPKEKLDACLFIMVRVGASDIRTELISFPSNLNIWHWILVGNYVCCRSSQNNLS